MANVTAGPAGPTDGFSVGALMQLAGGAVSVALVAGVCVWGAKLAMRDVSGLPVVQAKTGEMRALPEDPGGEIAANAGLTINTLVERGAAAETEAQVQLAPGGPDAVPSDLDVAPASVNSPAGIMISTTSAQAQAIPAVASAALTPANVLAQTATNQPAAADVTAEEMVAALIGDAAPLSDVAPAVASADATPLRAPIKAAVTRTVMPALRPAGLRRTAAVDPVSAALQQAGAGSDLLTATLEPGTRLAQFGVFDSAESAAAYWTRLSGRFDSYLSGKTRVIQKAQNTGGAFYRLRASGFADLGETRRLCAALQAAGQDCIPVVVR